VFIRKGESKKVTLKLAAKDLGYWDDGKNSNTHSGASGGWVVDPGRFELFAGTAGFTSWMAPGGLKANLTVLKAPRSVEA
jgi:hypothetical protein